MAVSSPAWVLAARTTGSPRLQPAPFQKRSKLRNLLQRLPLSRRVEFDAAGTVDAIARDAERLPTRDILRLRHEHRRKHREHRPHQRQHAAVAAFRPGREAGVDQGNLDAAASGGEDEVRPHLRLDQHQPPGPDEVQATPHGEPEVERIVDHANFAGEFRRELLRLGEARGRGRREHDAGRIIPAPQFADEFCRDADLTHADRVNPPDPSPRLQAGDIPLQFISEKTKTLAEVGPPSAAGPHLAQRPGRHQQQRGRVKQVIEQQNQESRHGRDVAGGARAWSRRHGRARHATLR